MIKKIKMMFQNKPVEIELTPEQQEQVVKTVQGLSDNTVKALNSPTPIVEEEWIWVEGYKATAYDMTCRDYQFEMNKVFTAEGSISLCKNGFHFCKHFKDVAAYYSYGRVFKVRAYVQRSHWERKAMYPDDGLKFVAKSIEFIDEFPISACRELFADACHFVKTDADYLEMIINADAFNRKKITELLTQEAGLVTELIYFLLKKKYTLHYIRGFADFAIAIHKQGVSNDKKVELCLKYLDIFKN